MTRYKISPSPIQISPVRTCNCFAAFGSCCAVTRIEESPSTISSAPIWQQIWLAAIPRSLNVYIALSTRNSNVNGVYPTRHQSSLTCQDVPGRFSYLGSKVMRNLCYVARAWERTGRRLFQNSRFSALYKTLLYLLYRQSIYYIDSRFIISTVDIILYRQSIYYIDSRFIISTADLLYRQPIYYIESRFIISTTPSCFSTCSCACACVYYYSGNAAKLCIVRRWFLGFSLVACPFN